MKIFEFIVKRDDENKWVGFGLSILGKYILGIAFIFVYKELMITCRDLCLVIPSFDFLNMKTGVFYYGL
jgi:hypothetical protein